MLLAGALAFNLAGLAPELSFGSAFPNDDLMHVTAVERMAQAVSSGENPIDCWVSEWVLGYPLWRSYQPLAHLGTVILWRLSFGLASLESVYGIVRYALVALFPLALYRGARGLGWPRLESGCAAFLAPAVKSGVGFGLEAGSYVWLGYGLYTQAWAAILLPLAIAACKQAVEGGRRAIRAGVMLAAVFLSHFVLGYVAALSAILTVVVSPRCEHGVRARRLLLVLATAGALAAFQIVPMLQDAGYVNHSRWEPGWKWDSFGHARVLSDLVGGRLFDEGRLPGITLACLAGVALCAAGWREERKRLLLVSAGFWVLLFFGRPTWGGLVALAGVARDFPMHRLIVAVHLFGLWLGGVGLAAIVRFVARRAKGAVPRLALAGLPIALLAFPLYAQASRFLRENSLFGGGHLAAVRTEGAELETLLQDLETLTRGPQGRAYAGLATNWGEAFRVGSTPVYGWLSRHHIPALSRMYHAMNLASESMGHFDERTPAHYRLFGIRWVVASRGQPLPDFLSPRRELGRFRILEAPTGGYFDLVQVPLQFVGPAEALYGRAHEWLGSEYVARRQHVALGFREPPLPTSEAGLLGPLRLPDAERFPAATPGRVLAERRDGEVYEADVEVTESCHLLFKMGFHPGWRAFVDGSAAPTVMLTPAFLGVRLGPGRHSIRLEYHAGGLKTALLLLGPVAAIGLFIAESRRH